MPSTGKRGRQEIPEGATFKAYREYLLLLDLHAKPNHGELATRLGISERTLKNWWARFNRHELPNKKDYGALAKELGHPDPEELARLCETANQPVRATTAEPASRRHQFKTLQNGIGTLEVSAALYRSGIEPAD